MRTGLFASVMPAAYLNREEVGKCAISPFVQVGPKPLLRGDAQLHLHTDTSAQTTQLVGTHRAPNANQLAHVGAGSGTALQPVAP